MDQNLEPTGAINKLIPDKIANQEQIYSPIASYRVAVETPQDCLSRTSCYGVYIGFTSISPLPYPTLRPFAK